MSKTIQIDSKKVKSELKKRGVTELTASKEIGYGSNYIASCLNVGKMAKVAVIALNNVYGIKEEEILPNKVTDSGGNTSDILINTTVIDLLQSIDRKLTYIDNNLRFMKVEGKESLLSDINECVKNAFKEL